MDPLSKNAPHIFEGQSSLKKYQTKCKRQLSFGLHVLQVLLMTSPSTTLISTSCVSPLEGCI